MAARTCLDAWRRRTFNRVMADAFTVQLGERSYRIQFGEDLSEAIRAEVSRLNGLGRRVAVVTDENVHRAQGAGLRQMFQEAPVLVVAPGESAKSIRGLERVLDFLAAQKI